MEIIEEQNLRSAQEATVHLLKPLIPAIAIALSISFVLAAPFNTRAHNIYGRYAGWLRRFQTEERIPDEEMIDPGDASVLVFGMGRVGTGAYDALRERFGDTVVGLDMDDAAVTRQAEAGRNVIRASATDADFWNRFNLSTDRLQLVLLALPNHQENLFAAEQLTARGFHGTLAAIAKYPDEVAELKEAGADAAFNLYAQAGVGLADDVCSRLFKERET